MQTILFGTRYIQVPTQLDELSSKQLIKYVELSSAKLTIEQFNMFMLLNILDIQNKAWLKWFFFKNEYLIPFFDTITLGFFKWKVTVIDDEDLHELSLLSENFHKVDKFTLNNPIPRIGLLSGPGTLFNNITFRQFRKAEEYYVKYVNSKNENDLNTLIGWLYTLPLLPNSLKLTSEMVERNKKFFVEKLSSPERLAILYFYLENRIAITKIYRALYPKSAGKSKAKKVSHIKTKMDFEKALRLLSGNINYDEKTDFQPCLDALAHLNDNAEEVEKITKKQDGTMDNN